MKTIAEKDWAVKGAGIASFHYFFMAISIATAIAGIYFIGFEQAPIAHDTFHDLRHAFGFPCH
ncbi:hypothetical protein MNBD_NITROSPINAE04-1338 [hydrothermal vent metagenome]|uniref:Uncharacterized protein n=1 Tax=hydrothermal vent metagenome TaxID=652676 RepID=A0A3B1CF08_9ZZZZ